MSKDELKAARLEINWHDNNLPVYSVDLQPRGARLATGGGDNNIRIWRVIYTEGAVQLEYLSTLAKHTQAVNVVRFDPKGEYLASASDDGTVMIWQLSDTIVHEFGAEDDEDLKESWVIKHTYRNSTSEVYDLSWSPDSRYITVGSMDNVIRIYSVATGQQVKQVAEHNHYVQGVTWDPRNEYIASQSADRSVHIYKLNASPDGLSLAPTTYFKITKGEIPTHRIANAPLTYENLAKKDRHYSMEPPSHKRKLSTSSTGSTTTVARSMSPSPGVQPLPAVRPMDPPPGQTNPYRLSSLYHNDSLQSFFRRLSFSPDGSLLLTASGLFRTQDSEEQNTTLNTVYIQTRAGLNKSPVAHLVGLKKPAIAIRFSPVIYKMLDAPSEVISLPYRMVFAVATQNSVVIYDTQRIRPIGYVSNIHYAVITDVCFSNDGKTLIISSADGFCSYVIVSDGLLGEVHESDLATLMKRHQTPQSKQLQSPIVAPTQPPVTVKELLQMQPEKSSSIEVIDITDPSSFEEETKEQPKEQPKGLPKESKDSKDKDSKDKDSKDKDKKKRRIAPTLLETKP